MRRRQQLSDQRLAGGTGCISTKRRSCGGIRQSLALVCQAEAVFLTNLPKWGGGDVQAHVRRASIG